MGSILGSGRSPRVGQPTPVFLPGKSHGQRSLGGYIAHGVAKESDITEWLSMHTIRRGTRLKLLRGFPWIFGWIGLSLHVVLCGLSSRVARFFIWQPGLKEMWNWKLPDLNAWIHMGKCHLHCLLLIKPMQEMQVWSLGQEDPLEKGMATHSSILAWRIPWREEPGRSQESDTT